MKFLKPTRTNPSHALRGVQVATASATVGGLAAIAAKADPATTFAAIGLALIVVGISQVVRLYLRRWDGWVDVESPTCG